MNKTWYSRMIITYVPIFLLISSFLFMLFFYSLSEQKQKEVTAANDFLSMQIMNAIDTNLKTIDLMITKEIISTPLIDQFFKEGSIGHVMLNYKLVSKLEEIMGIFPLIDSIYLVNFNEDFVLSHKMIHPLQEFFDQPYIQQQRNVKPTYRWSDVRPYRYYISDVPKRVVTFVQKTTNDSGMTVVNVRVDRLESLINDFFVPEDNFIHLNDQSGNVIFGKNIKELNSEFNKNVEFNQASDYTGWYLETGFGHSEHFRAFTFLNDLWVLLGLLSVVAGLTGIIYLTYRQYQPIKRVVTQIHHFDKKKLNQFQQLDEFKIIESVMKEMIDESVQLERQQLESKELSMKNLFYSLMEGFHEISLNKWEENKRALGVAKSCHSQRVLLVEINYYYKFDSDFNAHDQKLMKYALYRAVYEISERWDLKIWSEWMSPSQLSVIHFIDGHTQTNEDKEKVHKATKFLINWVKKNLKLSISVGIGSKSGHLTHITESYKEATDALNYKVVFGANSVVFHEELQYKLSDRKYNHFEMVHVIIRSFRFKEGDCNAELSQLFQNFRADHLSKNDICNILNHFIYHLALEISGMAEVYQKVWIEAENMMHDALIYFEELEEIQMLFQQELANLSDKMMGISTNHQYHKVLKEVKEYIENSYTDPNLSLELLNEKFGISAKNISKLFKEEFGVKFVDYMIKLRIGDAKSRLIEGDEPIQKIAEQVGYSGAISFSRVFKRMTGASPSEFSKLMRERVEIEYLSETNS